MILVDHVTLIVISGAIVAGFVQGLSGFAFGMLAQNEHFWGFFHRTPFGSEKLS
jgi:hypothetical protein